MIKIYRFGAVTLEKWLAQNDAVIADVLEGCLLDSLLCYTRRGVALIMETYLNSNSSGYTLYFAADQDARAVKTVETMWADFADAVGVE